MDDEFRSRDFRPDAHERLLRQMLQSLADDASASDPVLKTAVGKDHRAYSALRMASELVDAVAGWAIDHVYGLSLAGRKMLPRQPIGSNDHPEYLASRAVADDHDHEKRGGLALDSDAPPASPTERRLILRNLIFAGAGALPAWLRAELLDALDALDAGTPMPLLTPAKREGAEIPKARARLRLVAFVNFRWRALKEPKEAARFFIGKEIGRDPETLKDWEKHLKDGCLGALEVHRTITYALNAASHVLHARQKEDRGEAVNEEERALAAHHRQAYGDEALKNAVFAWRVAEGHSGAK